MTAFTSEEKGEISAAVHTIGHILNSKIDDNINDCPEFRGVIGIISNDGNDVEIIIDCKAYKRFK